MANTKNTEEAIKIEDYSKLVFKDQYAGANVIHIRANDGRTYPSNKDAILKRIKLLGMKNKDKKFFKEDSVEAAKKKA